MSYIFLIILQGFPKASTLAGMDLVTTLPAPIVTLSPMVTPGNMMLPPPIQTLFPIVTGAVFDTANGNSPSMLLLVLRKVQAFSLSEALTGWKTV